jgi:hypothetical protein
MGISLRFLINKVVCVIIFLMKNYRKTILLPLPIIIIVSYLWWREGNIVATATFNPGIAPFRIEVRSVPVLVTNSRHFIVSLYRGQYVVTSFRYFWTDYTPKNISINWSCIDHFTVNFDDKYQAICDWHQGRGANWSMNYPVGVLKPGLSPYYFTPRNPQPSNCAYIPLE